MSVNAGKGQKNRLKRPEVEDDNKVITYCDKKIETRPIEHNKELFSKVNTSDTCDDKTCDIANKDTTRERMLNGELTRGKCDEDESCNFLLLFKRKNSLQADEINEN